MSRLTTMARFEEPNEKELKILSYCEECGNALVEGQEIVALGDLHYCDTDCLYDNVQYLTLGECL